MNAQQTVNKTELVAAIQHGWDELQAYLATLSDAQITEKQDAGGWSIKDHIAHLAAWEDSTNALVERQDRVARMGIDRETWEAHNWDKANAIMQRRDQALTWAQVQARFRDIHARLMLSIESFSQEDLQRPYSYYQPDATADHPLFKSLISDTYGHYAEHLPWIKTIAES